MNTRPESDSDSEDLRPSEALIALAKSKKGAESFYDKEKDLYYSIDKSEAEKPSSSNTPIEPSENSSTQPITNDMFDKYRTKRPALEKDEVAPPLLYDAKDDVFYFKNDRKKQNNTSANSNNKQHGFFNKPADQNQGLSEAELEHRINTIGMRGNQPTEKFVYTEELAPSSTKERRTKEHALYKGRGVFGCIHYKRNEKPSDTGCQLYWVKKVFGLDILCHPFDDKAYHFVEHKNQLLYGHNDQFEEVKINDMAEFKKAFKAIMDTAQCRYNHKHITYAEINALITLNGGHVPTKGHADLATSPDSQPKKRN